MKFKRMLICLLALFATSISSCGEGDTSSTNSNNDDNTSYIDTTLNTTDDSTTVTSIDVGGDEDKDYSGVPATNVTIHYHADNGNYTNMQFYVWGEGTEGEAYDPTGSDDFGIYFTINFMF